MGGRPGWDAAGDVADDGSGSGAHADAWGAVWDDLAGQADVAVREEIAAEVADRVQVEHAAITLMDRVRGSVGRNLVCAVAGGGQWRGALFAHGVDYLVLDAPEPTTAPVVLPAHALRRVRGLASRAVPVDALGPVAGRRSLAALLRRVQVEGGRAVAHLDDGSLLAGPLALVGRDYVSLVDEDGREWAVALRSLAALTPW